MRLLAEMGFSLMTLLHRQYASGQRAPQSPEKKRRIGGRERFGADAINSPHDYAAICFS